MNTKDSYFDGSIFSYIAWLILLLWDGLGLFGQWLKWWFIIIITFGIYGFWIHIQLLQWKTKHTSFMDDFYDF